MIKTHMLCMTVCSANAYSTKNSKTSIVVDFDDDDVGKSSVDFEFG